MELYPEAQHMVDVRDAVARLVPEMDVSTFDSGELTSVGFFSVRVGDFRADVVNVEGYGVVVFAAGDDYNPLRGLDVRAQSGSALFEHHPVADVAEGVVRELRLLAELIPAGRFEEFGVNLRSPLARP